MTHFDAMPGTVWVGRVKSSVAPDVLERAFETYGKIKAVETGFAGFAFVRFLEDTDAEDAVKGMHEQFIQGVGQIIASKATHRGYKDAINKRDAFRRGYRVMPGERMPKISPPRRHPSASRSRSSQSSVSRKRSLPRRSPSPQKREKKARHTDNCSRSRSRSPRRSSPQPVQDAKRFFSDVCQLKHRDRHDVLCFFSGANVLDLILEALPVAREPDLLTGYPFAFSGLSQEEALESLDVASEFAQPSAPAAGKESQEADKERSIEVRQVISVDNSGRRFLRKAIFVNGVRGFAEQQEL
eukprot:TRINITY_DN16425_c0_g1_i1.p1 TRINITY_DN16425_c0_g1~~TRINITY_DN16425_c0_g1_i1.p1  ORF type:complete len:306 (-),score=55.03 TRINITY_DN16425_c0_g1_i1:65-958(-)